ncbi:hypothetical protein SAMD00019534_058660 [Acytostelium subglobosum LB1]|uniref:hypothetical protein n=1 Tax=Acytostelium subglobosum LB1 TaxID=1410327 RepID=UPI00064485DE|nr:hypothetical protein SAMD00019534_058660 [Acytostelium subglobosum LB1]GAM22691.1 hypothetical protein SAMD00019534_058660 [Acytostelium subglobosum LB1]|eukprot:XP_012754811.1 hypothetical protein SAMD00019534_058660 [Acytostelium subglobosum LB1]
MEDQNNDTSTTGSIGHPNNTTSTTTTTTKPVVSEAPPSTGWGWWGGISNTISSLGSVDITTLGNQLVESVQQMNIVETIKKTSDQMVNIYKEDLQEFSKSLYQDTTVVLQEQIETVKTNLATTGLLPTAGQQSSSGGNSGNSGPSSSSSMFTTTSSSSGSTSNTGTSNSIKASTNKLLKSLSFFSSDPSNIEDYEQWCQTFGPLEAHNVQINTILSGDDTIKSLYTKYVPNEIPHQQFWLKYFYKQYKSQKEEERRQLLLQKVATNEEDVGWDDEEIEINDSNNDDIVSPVSMTMATTTTTTEETETLAELPVNTDNLPIGSMEQPTTVVKEEDDFDSDEELTRELEQRYQEEEEERRKIKQEKEEKPAARSVTKSTSLEDGDDEVFDWE